VVQSNADLWLPYHPGEEGRVEELCAWLVQGLPHGAHLVCPLSIGGHRDHRLVRAAAERLGCRLWYYADYPYSAHNHFEVGDWLGPAVTVYARRVTPAGLQAWQSAVAAYTTQLSSFWSSLDEMRTAIAAYAQSRPGHTLWRPQRV
jgi:hypothetical protein